MNRIKTLLMAGAGAIALPIATPALAQEALSAPQADDTDRDIVVTANRREESQQKVAGVVQAFSQEDLRRDGITELRQLQLAVPGLSIANQEGNTEIYIRGVGSSNNTELGDPAAAPHLNGVYIPRPRGLGLMFYDLERVEVNKGPQGTLYGRNALAGTLNIITARPQFDRISGYVQAEVSNRSSYGAEGAINLPLSSNLAIRAAGTYVDRDYGFRNAGSQDLRPAGLEKNYAGRLSLRWEPTDRLSVFLMGDYGKETGTGYPGSNVFSAVVATGLRPEQLNLRDVVYRGIQGDLDNTLWGVQGKIGYHFDGFSAEYSGSYRSVDFFQSNAESDGIAYPGRNLAAEDYDNYSNVYWLQKSQSQIHEFRLLADNDKAFRWNLGAFYFNEHQKTGFLSLADKGYCCYSGTEFTMPKVRGRSYAFYADGTYDVTNRLRLIGGLRYTDERKSRFGIGGNLALTLGGENYSCCFATRFGTEGFRPAFLDRPNFDLSRVTTPAQIAAFLIQATGVPGARDTLIRQIGAIANGTNPFGTCFTRPDINNGFVTCPAANPADRNGGFSYASLTIPTQQVGSSKFNYWDWRAGFEFDVADDNMVYAKVSTGHKAGGFNDSFNPATIPETYGPEKVLVYEAGSRNTFRLFGRRATFNVTGFHYDYSNQVLQDLTCINLDQTQTPAVCNGYSLVNRNIGKSRITGVEAETSLQFPGAFRLDLNAVWLDAKIKSGIVADARAQDFGQGGQSPLINLAGNRLPLSSRIAISAKLSQSFQAGPGKLDWQALLNYRSSYYLSQFNEADVVFLNGTRRSALASGFADRQSGFVTLNLGIGYTLMNGTLRFEGFATNFLDEVASQKAIVGSNLDIRFLNDARSYGLRVIKRF